MPNKHRDQGATAVEYALIAGLIALVIVLGVTALGLATLDMFSGVVFP